MKLLSIYISIISNLPTNLMIIIIELDKMDQHTGGNWLLNGPKYHKDNHHKA